METILRKGAVAASGLGLFLLAACGGDGSGSPVSGAPATSDPPAASPTAAPAPAAAPVAEVVEEPPPPTRYAYPAEAPRVGGPGATVAPDERADQYFPHRALWAAAGVEGGIPTDLPVVATVAVGEEIQAAIDGAEAGVVALAAGTHALAAPLRLKAGVVLRGDAAGTTLEHATVVAVLLDQAPGSGLERLTLAYTDPEGWGTGEHRLPDRYASAPGFLPREDQASVLVTASPGAWLSDVTVATCASHPLVLVDSAHCTVRGLVAATPFNRGGGAGSLIVAGSDAVLLAGLRLGALRSLVLRGPSRGSVWVGSVANAGLLIREADRVSNLLVEDVAFLLPPAAIMPPISKGALPLGAGNVLMNVEWFWQGGNGYSKLDPEPALPYELNAYIDRVDQDVATYEAIWHKPIYRHQTTQEREPVGDEVPLEVPAMWQELPAGLQVSELVNGANIYDWLVAAPIGPQALELDIAEVIASPLVEGATAKLGGVEAPVVRVPREAWKGNPDAFDPRDRLAKMAKFDWMARKPQGTKVSILELAGGDWKTGLVLQQVVRIPDGATPMVSLAARPVGHDFRLFLGATEVETGRTLRLAGGYHLVTCLVAMKRKPPFIKDAVLDLAFDRFTDPWPPRLVFDTPAPDRGCLYPVDIADPLPAGERAALDDWDRLQRSMWKPDADIAADLAAFVGDHDGTQFAVAVADALRVVREAPHDETADLDPVQLGELVNYYHAAGLRARGWALGKHQPRPAKVRTYYPEETLP